MSSCNTHIVNLGENTRLQTVINNALLIHNCDMAYENSGGWMVMVGGDGCMVEIIWHRRENKR